MHGGKRNWGAQRVVLVLGLVIQAPIASAQPLEVDPRTIEETRQLIDRMGDSSLKHEMEQQLAVFEKDVQNGKAEDAITHEIEDRRAAEETVLKELPKEVADQARAVLEQSGTLEQGGTPEGGLTPEAMANVEKAVEESVNNHPELEGALRETSESIKEAAETSGPETHEGIEPEKAVEGTREAAQPEVTPQETAAPEVEKPATSENTSENVLANTAEQNQTETFLKNDPTTGDPIFQHADGTCHDHATDAAVPCDP